MTGRRLYDLYVDERSVEAGLHHVNGSTIDFSEKPVAWPYLPYTERCVWNAIARRMKGVKR
jgi:hypothetical protein